MARCRRIQKDHQAEPVAWSVSNPGGWWLHLRRCAECGHIGCCDNSPGQQHDGARQFVRPSGHP